MFTANATSPLPFGTIAIYRLVTAIDSSFLALASWIAARETRSVLSKLSDHQLADIGVSRSDIR